jgi:hypothetical protein
MDINSIKTRLDALKTTNNRKDYSWKPTAGKQIIRIVPYKFNKDNPFVELFFHYGVNGKTYLSPVSFGRPDPIVEFAEKLRRTGDSDNWRAARKMEPKLRTCAPVVVRGEESEGVRWWGFGKTVYEDLLGYIADPDYGDITDPEEGRDITIETIPSSEAGTTYPKTNVRIKPKHSPLSANDDQAAGWLDNQKDIKEIYPELTYDELKEVLEKWLNPDEETAKDETPPESKSKSKSKPVEDDDEDDDDDDDEDTIPVSNTKTDDIRKKFTELFDKKD